MTARKENPQPAGRPSKYNPVYCTEVISFLSEGYSLTAFAGSIGVAAETCYEWARVHPEFSDAVKKAQAKSAIWWENKLKTAKAGEAVTAIFGLKNRVSKEWRDRVEHSGPDGGAIQTVSIIRLASGSDNAPK